MRRTATRAITVQVRPERPGPVFRRNHLREASPSIGSTGIHVDRHSQRVKGILPTMVTHINDMVDVLDRARAAAEENGAGRVTLRFFLPSFQQMGRTHEGRQLAGFLRGFNGTSGAYTNIFEGLIPFSTGEKNGMLAYIAMNQPERISPQGIILHEQALARFAERGLRTLDPDPDYTIRHAQAGDVDQLVELYRVFTKYLVQLNAENVRKMVETTPLLVASSNATGRIVSALAAEHVTVPVEGMGPVDLIEISEAATDPDHRGKKLCSTMTCIFLDAIREDLGRLGVVAYAESRAAHHAPSRAFLLAGGRMAGYLNKHCILESDRLVDERGDFENLNVMHFRM